MEDIHHAFVRQRDILYYDRYWHLDSVRIEALQSGMDLRHLTYRDGVVPSSLNILDYCIATLVNTELAESIAERLPKSEELHAIAICAGHEIDVTPGYDDYILLACYGSERMIERFRCPVLDNLIDSRIVNEIRESEHRGDFLLNERVVVPYNQYCLLAPTMLSIVGDVDCNLERQGWRRERSILDLLCSARQLAN